MGYGRGIPAAALARIWDGFSQVDRADDRWESGLGLGLARVRAIAELHGGSVTVERREGEGSRFSIFLPAAPDTRLGQGVRGGAMAIPVPM